MITFNNTDEWYDHLQKLVKPLSPIMQICMLFEFMHFCTRNEAAFIMLYIKVETKKMITMKEPDYTLILLRCVHALTRERKYFCYENDAVAECHPLTFRSVQADNELEAEQFLNVLWPT